MFGMFEIRLFQKRTSNIEILYFIGFFVKREFNEKWQGGDIHYKLHFFMLWTSVGKH